LASDSRRGLRRSDPGGPRACPALALPIGLALVLLAPAVPATAQARDAVRALDDGWRFMAGDDPSWAAPGLDDGSWQRVDGAKPWRARGDAPAGGVGWYRRRIDVPPGQAAGVGLERAHDAAEIYLDGELAGSNGDIAAPRPGLAVAFQGRAPDGSTDDGELVVAVRVWAGLNPHNDGRVIGPFVGPAETVRLYVEAELLERWRRPNGIPQIVLGLFLAGLGIVHGLLYRRRREPEQGLFAAGATVFGLLLCWQAAQAIGLVRSSWFYTHFSIFIRVSAYALLIAFGAVFVRWPGRRLPGVTIALLLAAGVLSVFQPPSPWWRVVPATYGLAALMSLAMLVRGLRTGMQGARTLLAGFLLMLAWGIGDGLDTTIGLPAAYGSLRPWLSVISVGAPTLAMSVALSRRFADTLDELDRTYVAATRFVPAAFLELLGRATVTEVERGDSVALDMTVMFCDIRDFTTLSEARTAEANFRFINAFLAAMEPCIQGHGGFVGQYLGDGFLALFPAGASEPVAAGVSMQAALQAFNREQIEDGEMAIRVGIGLHSGRVMLGTIGGRERLDANVVSDVVNTASRVEGLSKLYGAPLVASEAALRLAGREAWETCELDAVIVKGRARPLSVFEVLAGEPDAERRARKRAEAGAYAAALAAFRSGELGRAAEGFADLRGYAVAGRLFVDRCAWYRERGLPDGWDGVVRLEVK